MDIKKQILKVRELRFKLKLKVLINQLKFQKLVKLCMDKKWDWRFLAKNPNITLEFIEEIPDQTIGFDLSEYI